MENGQLGSGQGWSPLQGVKVPPHSRALALVYSGGVPPWGPHSHLGLVSALREGAEETRAPGPAMCHSPETEIRSLSRWRKQSTGIARETRKYRLLGIPLMKQH